LTVGCAGSDHTFLRLSLTAEPIPADHVALRVEVSGARGGHSGEDVARGRANAIKVLGRVLSAGYEAAPFRLVLIDGGVSRNAIPREAHARVALPIAEQAQFRSACDAELAAIVRQYAGTDDGVALSLEETSADGATDVAATRRVLDLIAAIPAGVIALAPGHESVVETSTNLTVAGTESGTLTLASMARSSNAAALDELRMRMASLARLADAEIEVRRSYPPWEPNLASPLLDTATRTYARLFEKRPARTLVHGGLECAVLGQKLPGVEMISIGAEIVGMHAPGEMVRISSTQRFYRLLGALLDDLSR
jgi:dipeptidase D